MATVYDSQGTKAYLVPTSTSTVDVTAIETAIASGKEFKFLPDGFGDIGSTRNVQSYTFVDVDDAVKSLGSIQLGQITADMMFNAKDTGAQDDLRTMYLDKTRRKMIVVLTDEGATNPSYLVLQVACSGINIGIQKDNALMAKSQIEIDSIPVLFKAV